MGTALPLLGAPTLGVPRAGRERMTFPKDKTSPWGIQELRGGCTPPGTPNPTQLHTSEPLV